MKQIDISMEQKREYGLKETREWAQELHEIAKELIKSSAELKKRKAENTKLNKEAQLLMAKYRKEIGETFKGVRK